MNTLKTVIGKFRLRKYFLSLRLSTLFWFKLMTLYKVIFSFMWMYVITIENFGEKCYSNIRITFRLIDR